MVAWPVRAPLHTFSWGFPLKMDADLVLLNGRSITMDHRLPISQGLAVAGGRILLVGDSAGVRARMGPGTEIIDLGGRAVLPGFLEAHCHPPLFGRSLRSIDCRPDSVRDLSQFLAAVQAEAARREGGLWIRGRGYDDLRLPPKSALTRHDLDPVSPHHPVCLTR
jgi:predicted amidohydrolase YtcJ